jgi:hypothetical protein
MQAICNSYQSPLLKGTRTPADEAAIRVYCNFAQSRPYGPNPTIAQQFSDFNRRQRPCVCPAGYGYNNTAYLFSAGPMNFADQGQMDRMTANRVPIVNYYPGNNMNFPGGMQRK